MGTEGSVQSRTWALIPFRKYQFMEQNTQRRAVGLKDKIPDIQKTLETVRFLKSRKVRLFDSKGQRVAD